jgi:hypothetical protein
MSRLASILQDMTSYAVLWQNGSQSPMSGRLELEPHGLWLHGGNRDQQVRIEIPYDEIVGIDREPSVRIGPCRAIRLHTRAAGSLVVAAIAGIATQCDLLYSLQDAVAAVSF